MKNARLKKRSYLKNDCQRKKKRQQNITAKSNLASDESSYNGKEQNGTTYSEIINLFFGRAKEKLILQFFFFILQKQRASLQVMSLLIAHVCYYIEVYLVITQLFFSFSWTYNSACLRVKTGKCLKFFYCNRVAT